MAIAETAESRSSLRRHLAHWLFATMFVVPMLAAYADAQRTSTPNATRERDIVADHRVIYLWPSGAPGSESWTERETADTLPVPERWHIVRNVTRPTLTVFLPSPAKANGTAIIVCPGGGFRFLTMDNEGEDVAAWLNSLGVTAFVLKYRVGPTASDEQGRMIRPTGAFEKTMAEFGPFAAADASQALQIVREQSTQWGLKRDRIGILGFSAGGYAAASAAMHYDSASRPDFAGFIYLNVPPDPEPRADGPPIFVLCADDDHLLPTQNAVVIYKAWKAARLSAELHIYNHGGHGFGIRKQGKPTDAWTDAFREWLKSLGLL